MKKIKLLTIFLFIISFSINIKAINIDSKYVTLYNLDENEVVYSKDADEVISIASLTKIMTSIVTIENVEDLNTKVMVPYGTNYGLIEQGAARVGFYEGSMVTYNDLLHGALLPSGADSTRAMALSISGSEEAFVELMNNKAKELGMNNTHFVNCHGLDAEGHYSTINDVLTLLKYALENETFKKIYTTKSYTSSDGYFKMESTVVKTGKRYNVDVSNIIGSKTGFTYDAGQCLASLLNIHNTNFLLITAGAESQYTPKHLLDFNKVYSYLNDNYSIKEILSPNTLALTLIPEYSKETEVNFYTKNSVSKLVKNDEEINLEYVYNGTRELFGNEEKGTYLGTVDIIYDNEIIDTLEIRLENDLTFDLLKYLKQYTYLIPVIIGVILLITISIIIIKKSKKKRLKKA